MPRVPKANKLPHLPSWVPASRADFADAGRNAATWLGGRWARLVDHLRRGFAAVWAWLRALPRWVQGVVAGATVVLVAVIVFLAQPNWDWARPMVSQIVSSRLHRPVFIDGHLRVYLFSFTPSATVEGLRITGPVKTVADAPKDDLAKITGLAGSIELLPLFAGRVVLPRVEVNKPIIVAFQDAAGHATWDFSNGAAKGKPLKLPLIKTFIIHDGHVIVTSLQHKMSFKGTVNAREKADSGRQAFALTGDGSLNGRKFQLEATGGPLLNVRSTVPYPFAMTVRAGDTRITAQGNVLHPFDLGQLGGAVTVSGRNLADLYDLTGLTLPNTPAYKFSGKVTRNDMVYTVKAIKGMVGTSDIGGDVKVDLSRNGRPYLSGDLSSRVLDFKDLGALFGATDANAPSKPRLAADPQATRGRRLLPDASLDVERVRGMDAKVRYRAMSVRTSATMPLREVSLGINLDHGLMTLDPIEFSFPRGRLQGTASLDARKATQVNKVDMRLTGLAVQDFLPAIGGAKPLDGILDARVQATGTGHSVHDAASTANGRVTMVIPGGNIRQSFAELMGVDATKGLFLLLSKDKRETDIRCAVADFSVTNGVMQAQTIVFDTGVVLVNGSGRINLKDESLKLTFKGKPKKFRLVRINAPIVVGGHLSAPTYGVNAGPAVVQGGLTLLFHSIIPFLGLDTAKSANCSALLSDAASHGAPTTMKAAPKKGVAAVKVE